MAADCLLEIRMEKEGARLEMTRKVRKARYEDLDILDVLYENARTFMHTHGNPDQWNEGKPNRIDLAENIENGELYVVENNEQIEGSFALIFGEDPTYTYIDGCWLNEKPYAAVHKVASAHTAKGIGNFILSYCKSRCSNLKIDTHKDNVFMQNCIRRNGFIHTGIIYLANGDPRLAYQFSKDENK